MPPKNAKALIRFDGGARPTNPGHAGFACVVQNAVLEEDRSVIARYVGIKTNNQAEYIGMLVGVKFALFLGFEDLEIISDSKLVVNQVQGKWLVKDKTLDGYKKDILIQLRKSRSWTLEWEKRDKNADADGYCTSAINWGRNLNPLLPQSYKDKRPGQEVDPFAPTRPVPGPRAGRVRHAPLSTLLASLECK